MSHRLLWAVIASALLAGCGEAAPKLASAPERSAAANPDIRRMVLDAATSGETCQKLRDRFIGLRAKGPSGAAAGNTRIVGRWWIRGCEVRAIGDHLALRLSGPAWYWVDQAKSGYALHQYVYFDVDATMRGALDIGYDPSARLASIWFTPTDPSQVLLRPLTTLDLHAQNFFAWLLLPFARPRANGMVVAQGEKQFRDRLDEGVTMTVALRTDRQVDLLLGQLARGQAPERPFAPGVPWLVNERLELHNGGAQVEGPFPAERTSLDDVVEAGAGVDYSLVCERDLQIAFNSVSSGQVPRVPPSAVFQRGIWSPRGPETIPIAAPCPWYLVTGTRASLAVAAVRVRNGQSTVGQSRSKTVLVTLESFKILPTKPTGKAWDAFGGAPDPEFYIKQGTDGGVLAPKEQDTFHDSPNIAAKHPFELTPGQPIEIIATDRDVMFDDPIGTATLRYKDLAKGPEVQLPLLLGGATTGYVQLRVKSAP